MARRSEALRGPGTNVSGPRGFAGPASQVTLGDMSTRQRWLVGLCALGLLSGCHDQPGAVMTMTLPPVSLGLAPIASGLTSPLWVISPPGDTTRVFIVEQSGIIRVARHDTLLTTPFLDISSLVQFSGERGLLSLAFHPAYAQNGQFFVDYTDQNGTITIARYLVSSGDPNVADPTSGTVLLGIPHATYSNHNGGLVMFGPDGFLYIGTGDGGGGGDPFLNGQDSTKLLAKILRIDVNGGPPYGIPISNPFVGRPPAAPEVWAYGVRNPWRFAFDRTTGDLYIADVGQDSWEEIDYAPGNPGGRNYGWSVMEATHCFNPPTGCSSTGLTLPVYEYAHVGSPDSVGCSITGGFVYRGTRLTGFAGRYFFGDYCNGWIRSFKIVGGVVTDVQNHTSDLGVQTGLTSFGQDARGELYITLSTGQVYRIVPK